MTKRQPEENGVRQGLDLRKFQEFRRYARDNPDDVMFGLEASGVGEGRAVHTLATTGAYTLGGLRIDRAARRYSYHFGAHKEVEDALGFIDPTDREEVVEVALAALTGCINAVISVSAAMRSIDLETLRTDVRISWSPAVFLHLKDVEDCGKPVDHFGDLQIELTIAGPDIDADDVAFLKQTVQRSAIFNLITLPHEHGITVHVADTASEAA